MGGKSLRERTDVVRITENVSGPESICKGKEKCAVMIEMATL